MINSSSQSFAVFVVCCQLDYMFMIHNRRVEKWIKVCLRFCSFHPNDVDVVGVPFDSDIFDSFIS